MFLIISSQVQLSIYQQKNAKKEQMNRQKIHIKIYPYLHIRKIHHTMSYRQITRAANEADSLPINYMTKYAFPISKPGFV